jgi:hypothetical protein
MAWREQLTIGELTVETLLSVGGTDITSAIAEVAAIDGLTATAAELNTLDASALDVMAPSTVMDATVTYTSAVKTDPVTGIIHTQIYVDLTGAKSTTTDLDIIGDTGVCHLGQITAAVNGTITVGQVTCLETPATGADDIDLYSATEATGAYDAAVTDLTETALLTKGGAWAAAAAPVALTAVPAADEYLYLTCGEAGTVGTYTAGKFLIELWGV